MFPIEQMRKGDIVRVQHDKSCCYSEVIRVGSAIREINYMGAINGILIMPIKQNGSCGHGYTLCWARCTARDEQVEHLWRQTGRSEVELIVSKKGKKR